MIILLYIILGLLGVLLVGYIVNNLVKVKKSKAKPKVVKEKVKPEKKKDGLIIGTEKPDFRPEVKAAEKQEQSAENVEQVEKGAEEPVMVDDLKNPEEAEVESTIVKKDGKYIPSWDREELEDEETDELEEFRHFPALSKAMMSGETLSEQIRNLPPEIQALMLSNIFDRKE